MTYQLEVSERELVKISTCAFEQQAVKQMCTAAATQKSEEAGACRCIAHKPSRRDGKCSLNDAVGSDEDCCASFDKSARAAGAAAT